MIFFPISAMILSAAFTYFNIFERFNKKFLVMIFHLILLVNYLLIYWKPTKLLFVVFSGLLGYSSIVLNSIPFLLIDIYRRREDYPNNRGLGNDNSVCTLSGTITPASEVTQIYLRIGWTTGGIPCYQQLDPFIRRRYNLINYSSRTLHRLTISNQGSTNSVVCMGIGCCCVNLIVCQFLLHYE